MLPFESYDEEQEEDEIDDGDADRGGGRSVAIVVGFAIVIGVIERGGEGGQR